MKAVFNLKDFLTANKETVLNDYEKLTKQFFFNGISVKDFMTTVMITMQNNNPKSEKRALNLLPVILSMAIGINSKADVVNNLDDKKREQYKGTAFMSMV